MLPHMLRLCHFVGKLWNVVRWFWKAFKIYPLPLPSCAESSGWLSVPGAPADCNAWLTEKCGGRKQILWPGSWHLHSRFSQKQQEFSGSGPEVLNKRFWAGVQKNLWMWKESSVFSQEKSCTHICTWFPPQVAQRQPGLYNVNKYMSPGLKNRVVNRVGLRWFVFASGAWAQLTRQHICFPGSWRFNSSDDLTFLKSQLWVS